MIDIRERITDVRTLLNRYIVRNGYLFTAIDHPGNVYDAIIIKNPNNVKCDPFATIVSMRTLEENISFINENKLEKALIIAEDISFILRCPSLRFVRIVPANTSSNTFDYSPIYKMPTIKSLQCSTTYGLKNEFSTRVECDKVSGLERVHVTDSGYVNYNQVMTLKSLGLSYYKGKDISGAFCSSILDTLSIFQSKIVTLDGLEKSKKMQCLYLYGNRCLQDISALGKVKKTLKALRIENCPKIDDFSVLQELEELQLLELSGGNELPSLRFLNKMKGLKTFVFSVNVRDGDLSPALNLSYVYSEKNRKHYNLKDKDLPKGKYVRGNENIDEWRRLE